MNTTPLPQSPVSVGPVEDGPAAQFRALALATVTEENLRAIVDQVWEALLFDQPLWTNSADGEANPDGDVDSFTSQIEILGDWAATVRVRTVTSQAQQITQSMLGDDAAVDDEDVSDALAEVVNVVGGNLKALLPTQSTLGLPQAAPSANLPDFAPAGDLVAQVAFQWRGQPVEITVQEHPTA